MSVEALSQKWPFECGTDASFGHQTLRHLDAKRPEFGEVDYACASLAHYPETISCLKNHR